MKLCAYCQKRIIIRLVLTVLNLKPSELSRELNVSERKSDELDLFFIEQIFNIKVNDYDRAKEEQPTAILG